MATANVADMSPWERLTVGPNKKFNARTVRKVEVASSAVLNNIVETFLLGRTDVHRASAAANRIASSPLYSKMATKIKVSEIVILNFRRETSIPMREPKQIVTTDKMRKGTSICVGLKR
jgi:hypothetical protein